MCVCVCVVNTHAADNRRGIFHLLGTKTATQRHEETPVGRAADRSSVRHLRTWNF